MGGIVFDLRAEAEMRLFSEKLARELAGRRTRAPEGASGGDTQEPAAAKPPGTADAAPDAAGANDALATGP
ncbi:hypothetical protein [Streptomyces sp. NPDC018045]|uniref:hypothetical protein n=1 Tax=Streptomyces sp. NPDC018045 TaxID=3365037 RepID=UPI0037893DFF